MNDNVMLKQTLISLRLLQVTSLKLVEQRMKHYQTAGDVEKNAKVSQLHLCRS